MFSDILIIKKRCLCYVLIFAYHTFSKLTIIVMDAYKKSQKQDRVILPSFVPKKQKKKKAKGVVPARSGAYMIHSLQRAILQPYQCSEFSLLYCYPRAFPQYWTTSESKLTPKPECWHQTLQDTVFDETTMQPWLHQRTDSSLHRLLLSLQKGATLSSQLLQGLNDF